jgi:ABC-type bacteriocin/lantibiotic exporter with double-glycine peptidase domain
MAVPGAAVSGGTFPGGPLATFLPVADLTRSPGGPPSRRAREQRAYRLVLAGGAAGAVAVVTFVLAVVGVLGFGIPVLAVIVAVVCALLFRRTVSR